MHQLQLQGHLQYLQQQQDQQQLWLVPTPGPDKVIVKKAALVTMQKQMAALVRGEDLPAPQPGAREVQDVPYVVLVVGREDTRCPVCHLVYKTPYQLRKHIDVHRGEQFPCDNCSKLLASHQKGCIQGPSSLVRSVVGSM